MPNPVIKVSNLSKLYRLGEVGTGTISHDLNRWWSRVRGKEDPFAKVGTVNDRTQKAEKGEHVWALRDINFEVEQGEVLGIIGKNGAGKSTLLKLLSRVTSPTTGEIKAKGRIASLLEVGTGFNPEMTGRENIYMNGTILGMRRREITAKLDDIVDFAGVAKYLDTPTKRYSSGMTVRLGFAVAAFLEPEILIVDEVLAVGDAEFQKRAIGKMQDISKGGGRTVLFVSHNMASIKKLCKRGLLLNNGQIQVDNNIDMVIEEYLSLSQNNLELKVSERRDRIGTQEAKLIDYKWIDNGTGNEVKTIISGQNIRLQLFIQKNVEQIINRLEIGVSFFNKDEVLLFACRNSVLGKQVKLENNISIINLDFPKWPTSGGRYTFNVLADINGHTIDWLRNAGSINVEVGDYFNSGKIPAANSQSVFINYDFS